MVWKKILRRLIGVAVGGILVALTPETFSQILGPENAAGLQGAILLATYSTVAQTLKKFSGELAS